MNNPKLDFDISKNVNVIKNKRLKSEYANDDMISSNS